MRMLRDSVAEVTMTLKKQKNKGQAPLVCAAPLRGCGFEIVPAYLQPYAVEGVSVPLRGCGFEIVLEGGYYRQILVSFPSPCGDVVLK